MCGENGECKNCENACACKPKVETESSAVLEADDPDVIVEKLFGLLEQHETRIAQLESDLRIMDEALGKVAKFVKGHHDEWRQFLHSLTSEVESSAAEQVPAEEASPVPTFVMESDEGN